MSTPKVNGKGDIILISTGAGMLAHIASYA
ncbi:hypothetical protein CLV81_0074 [Flagellimonas meridianipacifica]|uniref:Uncharacterized protein n=1 Tax=Flagellimonas meridianipacifica TaxID=1080225 RepID=A0A2T0MEU7_9FLAO|nr:hypothetical protein CLV81_0074 [Allomuricauda pacifica]